MKIGMTSIPVNDVNKAYKFYTESLGFKTHTYMPEAFLAVVIAPDDRDGPFLLLEPNENENYKKLQEEMYSKKIPMLILSVEDIYKEYEIHKKNGVHFIKEPTVQDWGIETIFDDTCGNHIQFMQELKK